jgi:CheY-like chemotaxis protein
MRLLIIDDEPHIRQMMRLTLEVSGYTMDEAASGEDGLACFGDGRAHDADANAGGASTDCGHADVEWSSDQPRGGRARGKPGGGDADHPFRVRHPDGAQTSVVVTIDREAVARVGRLTHRELRPDGGFWRVQAERALAAYLWSEGQPPPAGQLILRDVSRDDIDVALAWPAD